jgi:hypothetical protein
MHRFYGWAGVLESTIPGTVPTDSILKVFGEVLNENLLCNFIAALPGLGLNVMGFDLCFAFS